MSKKWDTIIWVDQVVKDFKNKAEAEKAFRAEVAKAKRQLDAGLKALGASWLDRTMFKFVLGLDADKSNKSPKTLVAIRIRIYGVDVAKAGFKAIYQAKRTAQKTK